MFSAIRTRLRLRSVRARLTFWYLLTLGASLSAFAVFVFVVRTRTLQREFDADLEVRAHQLVAHLRPALLGLDVGNALMGEARAVEAALIVRELPGVVVFRSPAFPRLEWASERALAATAQRDASFTTVSARAGDSVRVVTLRVDRPGAPALAVQVGAPTAPVERALGQLAVVMMLFIVVVLVVASYGSGVTARRALAPVDDIVRRVRRIQATHLGERLDVRAGSDELDRLVTTLNDMLDRTEASVRSARRFAADVSHELQTPLAAMRGAVDMCLRGGRQSTDYQHMAVDLLADIERLSALVRDLRLLALAEAGQLVVSPDAVDLAAIATECCEIARAIAEDKQIHVETRVRTRPIVEGSALHLRRVVMNLAENAIRYSPASSTVLISVDRQDSQAVLAVEDHGCGIADADLPHIFEPFYRADPARARETGGTGLGLAIADQLVRAHKGRIEVASVPGEGSTFTVYLPSAPHD